MKHLKQRMIEDMQLRGLANFRVVRPVKESLPVVLSVSDAATANHPARLTKVHTAPGERSAPSYLHEWINFATMILIMQVKSRGSWYGSAFIFQNRALL